MEAVEFSRLNLLVLVVYLSALVWIGLRLAGKQRSTEDFFLGGRRMPWLAVGVSMFASLTSASSFLGVPGVAFRENISMVVLGLVSPLVAPLLILIFYPFYRQLQVTHRLRVRGPALRPGGAPVRGRTVLPGPHGLVGSGHLLSGPGPLGHDRHRPLSRHLPDGDHRHGLRHGGGTVGSDLDRRAPVLLAGGRGAVGWPWL